MKQWAGVIAGVAAGVVVAGAVLYGIALLWPGLIGSQPAPTTAAAATASKEAGPTDAALPTETAATPGAPRTGGTGRLPVTRLALQAPFEAQGFDFQSVHLGDNRERWVAASPDGLALVEIVGAEAVELASVSAFGPIRQGADGAERRAVYMLMVMNAVLPGWSEGAEWFAGEVVSAARQPGDYESETEHDGVRVVFSVDGTLGSTTLTFEPDG